MKETAFIMMKGNVVSNGIKVLLHLILCSGSSVVFLPEMHNLKLITRNIKQIQTEGHSITPKNSGP